MGAKYAAVAVGIVLLLSGVFGNASARSGEPTSITLEVTPPVANHGETVTFMGILSNTETGFGMRDKLITIYREGPITPVPIAEGLTGIDGDFAIEWQADLDVNLDTPVTVLAQFDGDSTTQPSRTNRVSFKIELVPINLVITSDDNKNRYTVGKKALFSVAFYDDRANFVDPELIKATYDGNFVSMENVDVGRYTFETDRLVRFENHQFGVFAGSFGYKSTQKSLTITVFGAVVTDPVKVTARMRGDEAKITVRNDLLSPSGVFTFKGWFRDAMPVEGSADGWRFGVDQTSNSFIFKSFQGPLDQDNRNTFGVKVQGAPTKLFWEVYGLHGKAFDSGITTVRPGPSK